MNAWAMVSSRERFYERSRQKFEAIVRDLDSKEVLSMTHSELERELERKGRELMRLLLQEHLEARGPGKSAQPVRSVDGVDRSHIRLQGRTLETIFGTVSIDRAGYGQGGSRSLHPLDAELNLPEKKYSLELKRRVAEQSARGSYDETFERIGKSTGAHVPKRQIEELVTGAAQDFDAFYERKQAQPAQGEQNASLLVLSVDGKGVVMRPEDLREQTRKAAQGRKHKMGTRLSKGEKKNAKRMATVASVYTIAPLVRKPEELVLENAPARAPVPRPRPEQKRVWASLKKSPEEVIEELFQEASYRDPKHQKPWVGLVDGNKQQIRLLRHTAKTKGIDFTLIVDVIHVIEYLWDAGRAFHPSGSELEGWVQSRLLEILRGKAGYVAGGMRRSATLRNLAPEERKSVDVCAHYLRTYAPYLKYHQYLAQGFPIATGVIEGACRHLVKDRMEVTGARWSLNGAEAILRLRALRSSHDFDEYWTFHEAQEYERNHRSLYADGIVPPTIKSRNTRNRAHLKIVK